jgi:uncharacterized protein
MRIIRKSDLVEGRWRNGMGVSWDIAADSNGFAAGEFGWRLAIARIDADVPFSLYEGVDRVFTMIEGNGLDLEFEDSRLLSIRHAFVPHFFSCEIPAFCHLHDGVCFALNLFVRRDRWTAAVDILSSNAEIFHSGPIILYGLDGAATADGERFLPGDTVLTSDNVSVSATSAKVYAARLTSV